MNKKQSFSGFLLVLVLMLAAWPAVSEVAVVDAYIRAPVPGQQSTAAFFTLVNRSATDCELIGASSPVAGKVEVHRHRHHGGMMQMREVDSLLLPAGKAVSFEPGGYHLMLLGVQQPLEEGVDYSLRLLFSGCSEQLVQAKVRSVLR